MDLFQHVDSAFRDILAGKEPHLPNCPGCERCLRDSKIDRSYPNAPDLDLAGRELRAGK